ncbi:hypothetical protein R1flu_012814 [Riccia fluitans]|uniref:Uncharacterized protein n=1 Tax=Riccia fluitans TaxID=41844 RepID=A0ABD1ZFS0_9MARC
MNEYVCQCDLPPSIQDVDEFDDRNKTVFNRCYNVEEVRSLDILQYGEFVVVEENLKGINRNPIKSRWFNDQYILVWESYELSVNDTESELFTSSPLAQLSSTLKEFGFIGTNGFISLNALVDQAFFTVPTGFIRAEVTYNCTTCDMCKDFYGRSIASGMQLPMIHRL